MQRDVKHEFTFSQPPEVVWEYLTDAELLAEWLMPNDFKLTVGHKFQFKTKPKNKARLRRHYLLRSTGDHTAEEAGVFLEGWPV